MRSVFGKEERITRNRPHPPGMRARACRALSRRVLALRAFVCAHGRARPTPATPTAFARLIGGGACGPGDTRGGEGARVAGLSPDPLRPPRYRVQVCGRDPPRAAGGAGRGR